MCSSFLTPLFFSVQKVIAFSVSSLLFIIYKQKGPGFRRYCCPSILSLTFLLLFNQLQRAACLFLFCFFVLLIITFCFSFLAYPLFHSFLSFVYLQYINSYIIIIIISTIIIIILQQKSPLLLLK